MRAMFGLIVLVFAGACGTATDPVADLTVLASADRAELPAGQRVVVDVTVTNGTTRPAELPGGPFALLEVRDASGRVVAFGRYETLLAIAYPPRQLTPGAVAADRAPWAGELAGSDVRAAAGTYRVRAAVPVRGPGGSFGYRYSPPITVVLTP